jgi:hypothetical protein
VEITATCALDIERLSVLPNWPVYNLFHSRSIDSGVEEEPMHICVILNHMLVHSGSCELRIRSLFWSHELLLVVHTVLRTLVTSWVCLKCQASRLIGLTIIEQTQNKRHSFPTPSEVTIAFQTLTVVCGLFAVIFGVAEGS